MKITNIEIIDSTDSFEAGTNPCSEIILRPNQVCNLSEIVVRATDTIADLRRKARIATILGTMQATLTKFRYLRPIWRKNTEEEALLGVSLTGIMDHPILNTAEDLGGILEELKQVCIDTNKEWAERLGINQSAAITCVKPSGTVSQLVDSASGIHPRFAPYYVRRVRADAKDPLAQMMKEQGIKCEEAFGKPGVLVFSFPMKAPDGAICVDDVAALDQLKLWKVYQDHWCEHKPSITVYYKNEEFLKVGQWVWDNFDIISGISFLPYSEHIYKQAPYEEINEDAYKSLLHESPEIDFSKLGEYEKEDNTKGTQTLSCSGGYCEIVDL
jgi:ribonucleoside-triphosphate reductase (thioredoxin)